MIINSQIVVSLLELKKKGINVLITDEGNKVFNEITQSKYDHNTMVHIGKKPV